MKTPALLLAATLLFLLAACQKDDSQPTDEEAVSATPNILLIIADDMGKDATSGFTEGSEKPDTPTLDSIKSAGITFSNFWVYPTCSPTRAAIITGKYGYRTGVKWAGDALSSSETILQRYLNEQTNDAYATAIIGKWHLSGAMSTANPEDFGLDYYAGITGGAVQDYFSWDLLESGEVTRQSDYITEKLTDLSIEWINAQEKPWFLWLAYTAPHTPLHVPPADMHSQGSLPEYSQGADPIPYFLAAIEAMDHETGRLLAAIPSNELENTVIIFLGDNGSPTQCTQEPYSHRQSKGTLYQGGINTPLFVSGPGVERTGVTDFSLVTATDLFATIAGIGGASVAEIHDSKSFKALLSTDSAPRGYQYAEMNDGKSDLWAISDGTYKLIADATGNLEMFDLVEDPYETNNLLDETLNEAQLAARTALEEGLRTIRD